MKHHISRYKVDGKSLVTSWLQFNIFGTPYCFSIKTVEV